MAGVRAPLGIRTPVIRRVPRVEAEEELLISEGVDFVEVGRSYEDDPDEGVWDGGEARLSIEAGG